MTEKERRDLRKWKTSRVCSEKLITTRASRRRRKGIIIISHFCFEEEGTRKKKEEQEETRTRGNQVERVSLSHLSNSSRLPVIHPSSLHPSFRVVLLVVVSFPLLVDEPMPSFVSRRTWMKGKGYFVINDWMYRRKHILPGEIDVVAWSLHHPSVCIILIVIQFSLCSITRNEKRSKRTFKGGKVHQNRHRYHLPPSFHRHHHLWRKLLPSPQVPVITIRLVTCVRLLLLHHHKVVVVEEVAKRCINNWSLPFPCVSSSVSLLFL